MDFFIRFIGIVMLVPLGSGPNPAYQALLPAWTEGETFCRNLTVEEHRAYIRVDNNSIVEVVNWTEQSSCDSEDCTLFAIPEASTLSVNPGFTMTGGVTKNVNYCLVPNFVAEPIEPQATLRADAISRTIADLTMPAGELSGQQLASTIIISVLKVSAPAGTNSATIRVTATPRAGGPPRSIVLDAGSTINVLNLPPSHAPMEIGARHHGTTAQVRRHFFLYHKLLDGPRTCRRPPHVRPCPAGIQARLATSPDISCSNGGCCP